MSEHLLPVPSVATASPRPELRLDWCSHDAARLACERWHYAKIVPRNKLVKVGVWEGGAFTGVVVFGTGASDALGSPYGLTSFQCCELVRVALKRHITPVTRIVRIALQFLRTACPGIRLVVSFADQEHGHHGGIYQGGNWTYAGLSQSSDEYVVRGRRMHGRAIRKTMERYEIAGVNTLERARIFYRDPGASVAKGSRKHRYLMPLDADMRAKIAPLAKPYPKRVKQATSEYPSESGGAAPTHTLQISRQRLPPSPAPAQADD